MLSGFCHLLKSIGRRTPTAAMVLNRAATTAVPQWPKRFDTGPDLREFYEKRGGATVYDGHRQMLGELLDAVDSNSNRRVLPQREAAFNMGALVLVITVVVGAAFLVLASHGAAR